MHRGQEQAEEENQKGSSLSLTFKPAGQQTPGGLGVPVPLFSTGTRRKHASTSKHSQELRIIPLPVVWETMKGICAPSMPELEDREEQGRENTWCKVRGRTWCGEVSACSSIHRVGNESLLLAKTSSGKDQTTQLEDQGHAPTHYKLWIEERPGGRALRGPWVPREASLSPHSIPEKTGASPLKHYSVRGSVPLPLRGEGGVCRSPHGTGKEQRGLIALSSPTPGKGCRFLFPHGHEEEEEELGPSPLMDTEEGKGGVRPSSLTEPEMGTSASFSPHRHREGLSVPFTSQTARVEGSVSLCPLRPRGWGGALGVPLPSRTPGGVSPSLSSPAARGRAPAGALTGFLMRRSRRRRCSSAALRGMTSGCGSLRGRGGRGAEGAAMFRPWPRPAPVTSRRATRAAPSWRVRGGPG